MLNGTPPGYSLFHSHILKVLGQVTERQADVLVPFTEDLCRKVIRSLGFNPDNLAKYGPPSLGWVYEGKSKPAGFRRKVIIAYQDLHTRVKVPLTMKGKSGQWGLTPEGVQALEDQELREKTTPNATAKFLDSRLKDPQSALFATMRRTVAMHMPLSVASAQIDDHVQTCLLRLISRDALRTRILMGLPVKDHHIASWAVRSAYTDARDAAKEPVTRELHGARTGTERASGATGVGVGAMLVWDMDEDSNVKRDPGSWTDIVDTDSSMSNGATEETLEFKALWERVSRRVNARCQSGERYMNILKMKMDGYTVAEIAEAENVSKCRATTLLAEARRLARDVVGPSPRP